jgi:hypothetical protein
VTRIHDEMLDCVIYLYKSERDANTGSNYGGSGVLVAVASESDALPWHVYAVTNAHVIRDGFPVIRLNNKAGSHETIPLRKGDWTPHREGHDVSICPIDLTDDRLRYAHADTSLFITEPRIKEHNVGPGDEVYMVGRFVNHEGRQRNLPTVRFGGLSMLPYEKMKNVLGVEAEHFLVDIRSISGFSGSPAFIHSLPFAWAGIRKPVPFGPWLLGLDCGHMAIPNHPDLNSGMAAVVPAWRIHDLLFQEKFIMQRREREAELNKEKDKSPIVADSKSFTKEDFESALKKASRKIAPKSTK